MKEYIIQGETDINQNTPLNNQSTHNEIFIEKVKTFKKKFISVLIILCVLEFIIVLISTLILFDPKQDNDTINILGVFYFSFPISTLISISIITTSSCCYDYPMNNVALYVLLFIIKGCCYIFNIIILYLDILGIILNILSFISLFVFSFAYQIKLVKLKKEC